MELVFDPTVKALHRARALRIGDEGAAFLLRHAAEELGDRLSTVGRHFSDVRSVWTPLAAVTEPLNATGKVENLAEIAVDEEHEHLPLEPQSTDLAVSLYALQSLNDVPGMLIQIRRILRPDGLFLGCMAGADTLSELRQALLIAETELYGGASPRVFPFADVRDVGALLQRAGFALPVADIDTVTVRYDTMFDLIRDLRAMGMTNSLAARSRKPASRRFFARAAEIYADRFADPDGRIRATFSTIWMSGWAPHESQQKPARRGSASVSLADALDPSKKS